MTLRPLSAVCRRLAVAPGCCVVAIALGLPTDLSGQIDTTGMAADSSITINDDGSIRVEDGGVGFEVPATWLDESLEWVETSFGWPIGTKAVVHYSSKTATEEAGESSTVLNEGTYTMDVEEHEDGLLIRHGPSTVTLREATPESESNDIMLEFFERVGSTNPNWVVSEWGDLLDVDGLDEMVSNARETFVEMMDSVAGGDEAAVESGLTALDASFNRDVLLARIDDQWSFLVSLWAGVGEWPIGAPAHSDGTVPSPLFPEISIPFRLTFGVEGWVPCDDKDPGHGCLAAYAESVPDPEQARAVTQEYLSSLGAQMMGVSIDWLEQEERYDLVVDPETMLPHKMSRVQTVVGDVSAMGQTQHIYRFEEMVLEYRYGTKN